MLPSLLELDQISAKFLKDCAPLIAIHLANITNLSLKFDAFPSKFKIPKIKPLLKKGNKTKIENHRPIPLLPLIPKVIKICS